MSSISNQKMVHPLNNAETKLHNSTPVKILVVDDDHATVSVVSRMVETLGFQVESTNGGQGAMQCLSQSCYDLVLTDLQMPDMDGYSLAAWLKQKTPETEVVIMTASSYSDVVNFMNNGIVDDWIFKPFNMSELIEKLSSCLEIHIPSPYKRGPQ